MKSYALEGDTVQFRAFKLRFIGPYHLLQVAGAHRVVTVELHASQIQGFATFPIDNMYAGRPNESRKGAFPRPDIVENRDKLI